MGFGNDEPDFSLAQPDAAVQAKKSRRPSGRRPDVYRSIGTDEVQEPAFIAEIGEVVTYAKTQIVVQVTVDTDQPALTGTAVVIGAQMTVLDERIPGLHGFIAGLYDPQIGGTVEPRPGIAGHPRLTAAMRHFGGHFPIGIDAVDALQREHMRTLVVIRKTVLAEAAQIVQIGVAAKHIETVIRGRTVGESDIGFDEFGIIDGVKAVFGIAEVQMGGDTQVDIGLVQQPVGTDPLPALFGTVSRRYSRWLF